MISLTLPISDGDVRKLHVGDTVSLSGVLITGRDSVHKWMTETFVTRDRDPQGDDKDVYEAIKPILNGSAIYHCGPVVAGLDTGDYRFTAAGPTTSTREEPFQAGIMRHFNLKAVIGKGGMGGQTLAACREVPGVYLHAIGGAASLIAQSIRKVHAVYKLDFGVPEAMWVIEAQDFPAVVTMDSHSNSLHTEVEAKSKEILADLLKS